MPGQKRVILSDREGSRCSLAGTITADQLRAWRAHVFAVFERISFHDDFESGNLNSWQFPYPEDWAILSEKRAQQGSENGAQGVNHYLHMKRNREPGMPRRPLQFALLKKAKVGSFDFQARVRREGKSMIVVFNYADTLHFYYTHLSTDSGAKVDVHNGIFIVDGGPRRRIAGTEAAPALPDAPPPDTRSSRRHSPRVSGRRSGAPSATASASCLPLPASGNRD